MLTIPSFSSSCCYCYCCCAIAFRPRDTATVMSGKSVNLIKLFLGRLTPLKWLTSTKYTYVRQIIRHDPHEEAVVDGMDD